MDNNHDEEDEDLSSEENKMTEHDCKQSKFKFTELDDLQCFSLLALWI